MLNNNEQIQSTQFIFLTLDPCVGHVNHWNILSKLFIESRESCNTDVVWRNNNNEEKILKH